MKRVLRVPAMDLREGDLVSFHQSARYANNLQLGESRLIKSRQCKDCDGTWLLVFEDDKYTQFADMCDQFTLILEVKI